MEYIYSNEWINLFKSAIDYQENLRGFLKNEDALKLKDLKEALKDRESVFYALKIIENVSDNIIQQLLSELVWIVFFCNVSDSYSAKKIILDSNRMLLRNELCELLIGYSKKEKEDIYVIKDIALFLYELEYKKELLQFVENNLDALRRAEFIENDDDLKELYEMEDF